MVTSGIANLILIPYLWWFGYALDETSVAECRDSISVQQKECLCTPECPYCTGKCKQCFCIYEPLPDPGPGKPPDPGPGKPMDTKR
jgi:hypothetical protein